jgi:hypothetical protein
MATVTVTPQVANNMTIINLNRTHPAGGSNKHEWLDLALSAGLCTTWTTGAMRLLERARLVNLDSATTLASAFDGCLSLQSVTLPELPVVTTLPSKVQGCSSLKSLTIGTLPDATTVTLQNMATACQSLQVVEVPAVPLLSNAAAMFNTCSSLTSVRLNGINKSIGFNATGLSGKALNQVYEGLATVSPAQTIDVRGNWGRLEPDHDPTIATAKGWTVLT